MKVVRVVLLTLVVLSSFVVGSAAGIIYTTKSMKVNVQIEGNCQVIWPDFLVPRRS
jgi:hypothetical protein